jgi:hypothetical protein
LPYPVARISPGEKKHDCQVQHEKSPSEEAVKETITSAQHHVNDGLGRSTAAHQASVQQKRLNWIKTEDIALGAVENIANIDGL